MAYDEDLVDRVRDLVGTGPEVTEKRMFGGLAFLLGGHIAVAVSSKGGLMARCDPDETEALLAEPGARPFEMRGRELDGWLRIDADGTTPPEALRPWVQRGVAYARSLPPNDA
jgi:hypothetical protein